MDGVGGRDDPLEGRVIDVNSWTAAQMVTGLDEAISATCDCIHNPKGSDCVAARALWRNDVRFRVFRKVGWVARPRILSWSAAGAQCEPWRGLSMLIVATFFVAAMNVL